MEVKKIKLEERIEKLEQGKFNFHLFIVAFTIIGLISLNFPTYISIRLIIHIIPLFVAIYFVSNNTFNIVNKVITTLISFVFFDILVTIFVLIAFFSSDGSNFLYLLQKMYFLN